MKGQTMFIKKIKLSLCVGMLSFTTPANAENSVVVGLFEKLGTLNTDIVKNLGCTIFHSGNIVAQQGNSRMKQPDQFIIMTCEGPLLHIAQNRQALSNLYTQGRVIAVLEGHLTTFDTAKNQPALSKRQYILKLGYYNNTDVDLRENDLLALNRKVAPLEGHWTTEGFIDVNHAMGIPTPDEMVIIYYDTAKIGKQFRDQNKDILNDVGAFNDKHLTEYSYLIGANVN